MKKLLPVLFLSALSLSLVSCLGEQKGVDASPVSKGRALYSVVQWQNALVTDPALLAFRLNVLLETASVQGTPDDIDNVMVQYDGTSTNLKEFFFGRNTVQKLDNKRWQLVFEQIHTPDADNAATRRSGTIIIDTDGLTLGNLSSGDQWSIDTGSTGYTLLTNSASDPQTLVSTFGSYYIQSDGFNSWIITGNSTAELSTNQNPNMRSDWDFDLKIKQVGNGGQSYDDITASTYEMSGSGSGQVLEQGEATFYYDIRDDAPLKFRAACKHLYMLGGAEVVSLDELSAATLGFEKNYVKYQWGESGTGTCQQTVSISYNGYTYNPGDDELEEDGTGL